MQNRFDRVGLENFMRMLLAICICNASSSALAMPDAKYVAGGPAAVTRIESGNDAVLVTDPIYEGPSYIDAGQQVAFMRSPVAREAQAMSNAFYTMCGNLEFDQAKFDVAAAASGLGLKRTDITLNPSRRGAQPMKIVDWQSGSVRSMLWTGRLPELEFRTSIARKRGLESVGLFRPSKQTVAECEILFDTKAFHDPAPLIADLTAKFELQPVKIVIKSKWADGYWQLPEKDGHEYKIVFTVLDMAEVSQTVHIVLLKSTPKLK